MLSNIIYLHFNCLGQTFNRQLYSNILALFDGVLGVILFSIILIKPMGINGVYFGHILGGIVPILYIIFYAWYKSKRVPRKMEDLMLMPDAFGVEKDDVLAISIDNIEDVVDIARRIQSFCLDKGIDKKRSYIAALATEEMASNIVEHGFTKDNKNHSIDVRAIYKNKVIILKIRDNCIPFNPEERSKLVDQDDITKNIGIRMIYKLSKDIQYQNILGLNVLTMRI